MPGKPMNAGHLFVVSITGVDGSGKSSVLSRLEVELAPFVCGVHIKHLAHYKSSPTKTGGTISDPRPWPWLVAISKFIWRAVEWTLQYRNEIRRQCDLGYLFLFDRFYFDDLIINPAKYRYRGPLWPLRLLRRLVPGPSLYILLDVTAETALARKPESTHANLRKQREAFLELARRTGGKVIDANRPLAEVVSEARTIILDHLAGAAA